MASSMRSSVDNPLWEDASDQPCSGSRTPLSPVETALQALAINGPRSSLSKVSSAEEAGFGSSVSQSCKRRSVPLSFDAWRPSSSEVRRAMTTQPAAAMGSSGYCAKATAFGSAGAPRGSRSASLSPVCWSLDGSQWAEKCVWQHSDTQHSDPQRSDRQSGSQQRPDSPESLLAPLSPQPTESPLKRLRLSTSPPDGSLSAAFSDSSPAADAPPSGARGSRSQGSKAGSPLQHSPAAGVGQHADASQAVQAAEAVLQQVAGACLPPGAAAASQPHAAEDCAFAAAAAGQDSDAAGSAHDPASPAGTAAASAGDSPCDTPIAGRSLRKQEAALEARRRADLADLRSIMAAGAAAHGCTSPAPTLLQGLLGEDDTSSEAASPRVLADAVRSGSPSLFGNCGGTPASELVARALATPGYAAPAATAAAGWEPHSNLQRADALPDSAAAGLRRDATGMAALLEDLQCRLDGIRSCAALEASSPDACAATAAAADSADGSASLVARLAAAEAALTASAAEAAGLWAALAASKARAADFQDQLEAATAAGARAEQQLARVLADWRASVAQMAATQMRLSNALKELAAGGCGAAAAVSLAAALGHGHHNRSSSEPLKPGCRSAGPVLTACRPARPEAASVGSRNRSAAAAGSHCDAEPAAGYEVDLDVADRRSASRSPLGARRSTARQQPLDLRSSIAAAEARLSACTCTSEAAQHPGSAQTNPSAAAAAARLQDMTSGSSGAGLGSAANKSLNPEPLPASQTRKRESLEPMGDTTPRCSSSSRRASRAAQGRRSRLRVPQFDMDGKLAALAQFSATLDADLPLSWSHGDPGFGAVAAADAGTFGTLTSASGGGGSRSSTAASFPGPDGSQQSSGTALPGKAAGQAAAQTPGEALERRLACKRHLAAAVEADAALSATRSPRAAFGSAVKAAQNAAAKAAASGAAAAAGDDARLTADRQPAASTLALSPPAPAAEVAIAAARQAAEQQTGQQHGIGLWRRMLGGLGVLGQ